MKHKISIQDLLTKHCIAFREANGEVITHCLFNNCDADSRPEEAHLYIDPVTTQYQCKKCGASGNFATLDRHLADTSQNSLHGSIDKEQSKYQAALPARITKYLTDRGITPETICVYGVGYCTRRDSDWITIPIPAKNGTLLYHKLRQDPAQGNQKTTSRKGVNAQLYGWDILESNPPYLLICEGELDRLALISRNVAAVTSTHGAGTFEIDWLEGVDRTLPVYVCFDHDEPGQQACEKLLEKLHSSGFKNLFWVHLPEEVGDKGDITDYLVKGGRPEMLFNELASPFPPQFDPSLFKPMKGADVCRILNSTIKGDDENKLTVFLACLSAYLKDGQINVCMAGRSSSGKTHITQGVLALFPQADVITKGACSPTAFFHDSTGEYDKATNTIKMDFEGKILAFLDQPNPALLAKMRPIFSHDAEVIRASITDRNEKGGNRTKHIEFHGHPAVLFCTASNDFDEQEITRSILLSPRLSQAKLEQAVKQAISFHGDVQKFTQAVESDPERLLLKDRISAIKYEGEKRVIVPEELHGQIQSHLGSAGNFQPRSARDASRIMSVVKCFAMLNKWHRARHEGAIVAAQEDYEEAVRLWAMFSAAQDNSLPPSVLEVLCNVVGPLYIERYGAGHPNPGPIGLTQEEIIGRYLLVNGNAAGPDLFRSALPLLALHHFVEYVKDPADFRRKLIKVTEKGLNLVELYQERPE